MKNAKSLKITLALILISVALFITCGRPTGIAPGVVQGGPPGIVPGTEPGTGGNQNSCVSAHKMFLTAATYDGNLGGVTGADAKCMSDANYPGVGTYHALITDGTTRVACSTPDCTGGISEHVDWVLLANATYCRTDGTIEIGTTSNIGLINYPLANTISASTNTIWTGLHIGWTDNLDCSHWSDNATGPSRPHNGNMGDATSTTDAFVDSNSDNSATCNNLKSIICVEQ